MKDKPLLLVAVTTALLALVGFFMLGQMKFEFNWSKPASTSTGKPAALPDRNVSSSSEDEDLRLAGDGESADDALLAALRALVAYEESLKNRDAIPHEAIFTFKDKAAYDKFLAEAAAAGLKIKDQNADMLGVRIGYDNESDLRKYVATHPNSGANIDANYVLTPPPVPADRSGSTDVGFGGSGLDFLGVKDNTTWGQGVKIAVLDSAVSGESVFGNRLTNKNVALDGTTDLSHGTSVAAIAAGTSGVAPASTLLSIGVVGADGMSDSFTLAGGIREAVKQGAQVLNISLGSYGDSLVLANAVIYATENGAVIVASAGNDAYNRPSFPARYENVVAVGAVGADGQVVSFSNAVGLYGLSAPGLEIVTYTQGGKLVYFSGTSAAAPFISALIASEMSLNPGINAQQAVGLLQTNANDAGAPGQDADYGYGLANAQRVDLRNVNNRTDAAVASHYFNLNDTNGPSMTYVVQNQGTSTMANWQLNTTSGGVSQNWNLPSLLPNQETVVTVPVNANDLADGITFRSRLVAPAGSADVNLNNNGRATGVQVKPTTGGR